MAARSVEDREALRIEGVRRRNAERRDRILDPRARQLGMDYGALERQIEEKRKMKELEEQRDRMLLEQQEVAISEQGELERHQKEQRRIAQQRTDQFNAMQAETHFREREVGREAALGLARSAQPEPTVSGATAMSGEDPGARERQKVQARQQEIWAAQQMHERAHLREVERLEEEEHERQMAEVYRRAQELEAEKRAAEEARMVLLRQENERLAAMRREREQKEKDEEAAGAVRQTQAVAEDLAARETTFSMPSAVAPSRILTTEYRGMNPDQLSAIHEVQVKQEEEKRREKEEKEKEERRIAEEMQKQVRESTRIQRQIARQREEAAAATREANLRLAQQKAEDARRLRAAYENQVDDSFFEGFGHSVR